MNLAKTAVAGAPRLEASIGPGAPPVYEFDDIGGFVGHTRVSGWIEVDQEMINRFAQTTRDEQWIHVDIERCKRESPFGAPVAHGFLTLSLLAPLLIRTDLIPADASQAINCGVDNARFLAPVISGDRVRSQITLVSVDRKHADRILVTTHHVLEVEGRAKPALTADLLLMLYR